ncbi:MAG: hypothetical protein LBJ73_02535 [Rickettsiales bacterium]|jgi:hypothetical protein|nr:hypothetical protein [Rickettsiales bacterium]
MNKNILKHAKYFGFGTLIYLVGCGTFKQTSAPVSSVSSIEFEGKVPSGTMQNFKYGHVNLDLDGDGITDKTAVLDLSSSTESALYFRARDILSKYGKATAYYRDVFETIELDSIAKTR